MKFLKLIRYQNLLMLAFMQLVFKYGFLEFQNVPLVLNYYQYAVLVLSTVCIAAGGYLINNIFDQETDNENKPNDVIVGKYISEKAAYNYYIILNILGVAGGFYLSNGILKPEFSAIFIIISATLYLYASSLKQSLLIGNFIVALLLSFSILIIGIYDLYPMLPYSNQNDLALAFMALIYYAIFAFVINFIREIVKDLEDVNGDYNQGMSTLPIVLGVARTAKIIFGIALIPTLYLLYYVYTHFFVNDFFISTGYFLAAVIAPLVYFNIKMATAKTQAEFHHLSTVLKVVLFFGILSILVVSLEVQYHA